jgi:ABC-type lipoprotein export system ATPase subunit
MQDSSTDYVLELSDIKKIYKTGDENTVALGGVNLKIKNGEFVAIMGPSGSGKSTLMHIIGLLDKPTSGKYLLDGKNVSRISKNGQSTIRNQKIGFVFQQFNLLPRTTVLENVLLPITYGKTDDAVAKAKELIKEVGLEARINHKSNQLSGGQIQRVAIARALIMGPSIILADEPTGNLDSKTSKEIIDVLKKINKKGATIILITHEEENVLSADRIIRLRDGKVVSENGANK